MSLTNDEVLDVMLQRKPEKTVPFSVWHHFAPNEFFDGMKHPEMVQKCITDFKKYVAETDLDFVKLMTDGFFHFPMLGVDDPNDPTQLVQLKEIDANDPWIQAQLKLIQQQLQVTKGKLAFYNIFSPLNYFKWALVNYDNAKLKEAEARFGKLYRENPQVVTNALDKITAGVKVLVKAVSQTDVTGIYYSTQSIQDPKLVNDHDFFTKVQEKVDLNVAGEIDHDFAVNILHICGFAGWKNHLKWYANYPFAVVNYAVHSEKVPLQEGKKIFKDKVILGGLDITEDGTIFIDVPYDASLKVKDLVKKAGKERLILGADCTIQRETPLVNITTIRDTVHQL